MNGLWSFLGRLLGEAKGADEYRDDLLRYITMRYGEHEADRVRDDMQRMSPQQLARHLETGFVDDRVDALAQRMISAGVAAHPGRAGTAARFHPQAGASTDKGSGPSEPIPQRPDRSGGASPLVGRPTTSVRPGEKPVHAVGTAGQHRPKDQPSQRSGIVPVRPGKDDPRSGVVAAQKAVDSIASSGRPADVARADAMARRLGIPTTRERTTVDDKGRSRTAIWPADRVLKHRDPDLNPDAGEAPPEGDEPISRLDLIKHGLVQRKAGGVITPNFPGEFIGQRWRPHGRVQQKVTSRPDPTTGRWAHGKTTVDPATTGPEVVWDGSRWIPAGDFDSSKGMAQRAWRASQHPPSRKQGVHAGQGFVPGSPGSKPRSLRKPAAARDDFDEEEPTDPDALSTSRDDDGE